MRSVRLVLTKIECERSKLREKALEDCSGEKGVANRGPISLGRKERTGAATREERRLNSAKIRILCHGEMSGIFYEYAKAKRGVECL